jgi:hypothetical protein
MGATEETKATDLIHIGCGGTVLDSLDGPFCGRCRADLREEDWIAPPPPGASLDELRIYAERVSQETGMATVIVAVAGARQEYVATPGTLGAYKDAVSGALIQALRQRQELLGEGGRHD